MSETLNPGDYVRVSEAHKKARVDSVWELEELLPEEIEHGSEGPEAVTYPATWIANSTDGMYYGYELDPNKIEKITDNIPFRVGAIVETEVYGTVYASNLVDALKKTKEDPYWLLQDFSERSDRTKEVWATD